MKRSSAGRTLISERRIRARVRSLGRDIRRDYRGRDIALVGLLKGSFIFMADLARAIGGPLTCDFLRVSSYGAGTVSTGRVRMEGNGGLSLKGRHVLLVEDIIDTGRTVHALLRTLRALKPASLRVAALLHKPARATVKVRLDYVGFRIPDAFVVGYGLDFNERHRNLAHIAVLE
jgi:hypoxanthine phosphoribosyltransferase